MTNRKLLELYVSFKTGCAPRKIHQIRYAIHGLKYNCASFAQYMTVFDHIIYGQYKTYELQ